MSKYPDITREAGFVNPQGSGYPHPGAADAPPMMAPPPYFSQPEPQPQPPQTNIVVISGTSFGPKPAYTTCPSCHAQVTTRLERDSSTKTHLIALVLCLVGCWPCCVLPYCMDSCQNANHYCPNCNAYIGAYKN